MISVSCYYPSVTYSLFLVQPWVSEFSILLRHLKINSFLLWVVKASPIFFFFFSSCVYAIGYACCIFVCWGWITGICACMGRSEIVGNLHPLCSSLATEAGVLNQTQSSLTLLVLFASLHLVSPVSSFWVWNLRQAATPIWALQSHLCFRKGFRQGAHVQCFRQHI